MSSPLWYQGWDVLPCVFRYPITRYGVVYVQLPHEILGRDVLPNVVPSWYVLPNDMLSDDDASRRSDSPLMFSGSSPLAEIPDSSPMNKVW